MSFTVHQGSSPVILAFPHVGTTVPDDVAARLNDTGKAITDTDWHVDRLYAGLLPEATTLTAGVHRYVIDLNRDPSGASLYPGQNTTSLVPLTDFDNNPIWLDGEEPDEADIAQRIAAYHTPYHDALRAEVTRVKAIHGVAVVYDCHSIRSRCPFLFEGVLSDLNIGTNGSTSCTPALEAAVVGAARDANGYSHIVNGRFKGGWTVREHADPANGISTIQMELAQSTHLTTETLPFDYDEHKASRLRAALRHILRTIERVALQR